MEEYKRRLLRVTEKENTLYLIANRTNDLILYGIEVETGTIYLTNVYVGGKIKLHNYFKRKKLVELDKYVINKIKQKAINDLRLYKINNINDYSFYNFGFVHEIKNKMRQDLIDECRYISCTNANYSEINRNIVKFESYGNCIKYNLKTDDIELIRDGKKVSALDYYFSKQQLYTMLAQEQYKKGIAPKILNEFVKLQDFLKDKASVRIITKDNVEHTFKARYSADVSNMIEYYAGKFEISKYWINENQDININDILCLKYGKKEHYLNTACFANCNV